ncbi:MAG: hypothetical protein F7B59_07025 [Desulfurococcales archaeon]|nr:hypothetical protein [Desulfurococcales archaeon]
MARSSNRIPADKNIRETVRVIIERQFGGKLADYVASSDSLEIELSPRTGRIRHVFIGNKRILTMRASDGLFTISLDFARIVLDLCKEKKYRVISEKNIELKGSLLVPGVVDCDENIRPGDEVVIIDVDGRLLGVGKARISCVAMKTSLKGEAVRVRARSN